MKKKTDVKKDEPTPEVSMYQLQVMIGQKYPRSINDATAALVDEARKAFGGDTTIEAAVLLVAAKRKGEIVRLVVRAVDSNVLQLVRLSDAMASQLGNLYVNDKPQEVPGAETKPDFKATIWKKISDTEKEAGQ